MQTNLPGKFRNEALTSGDDPSQYYKTSQQFIIKRAKLLTGNLNQQHMKTTPLHGLIHCLICAVRPALPVWLSVRQLVSSTALITALLLLHRHLRLIRLLRMILVPRLLSAGRPVPPVSRAAISSGTTRGATPGTLTIIAHTTASIGNMAKSRCRSTQYLMSTLARLTWLASGQLAQQQRDRHVGLHARPLAADSLAISPLRWLAEVINAANEVIVAARAPCMRDLQ